MADFSKNFGIKLSAPLNETFYKEHNETNKELFENSKPGVYSLPYLYEKFLNKDYSRSFAEPKLKFNSKLMELGYYPNKVMTDFDKAEMHYQKLNEMFKLEA